MTNLTLGIGLQGKPNDYTGLYAKAYAQKAAGDAEQRKADKAALDAAMKDVEIDQERVHPALRDDYRREVARIYDDIQGEFQKDPRGAISQVRRKMIDYQSGLNSYLTSSDALFAIEKLDPNKVNIPDDLVREFRNAQNFGTAGLMKFYEDNRGRLEPFGISFSAPSAEGYAPEVAAMVVPRVDVLKEWQARGNALSSDLNEIDGQISFLGTQVVDFGKNKEEVQALAAQFFSDPVVIQNARIQGIDIFDASGNVDLQKAFAWGGPKLQRDRERFAPRDGGGGGNQDRPVAFEGQGLQLFAFGNAYDVETSGGIAVPNKSVTITIGKGTITSKGTELDSSFMDERNLSVNNLQTLMVYRGPDIEIKGGVSYVPSPQGGYIRATRDFTIKKGMPVPQAWISSPEFSGLLRGKVYEQKFLVGKIDSPGTDYGSPGSLGTPEGGVYVPITDDIKAKIMATYGRDGKVGSFLSDIRPKPVPIGGASRPAGGTSRPAQPASNAPASNPDVLPTNNRPTGGRSSNYDF